MPTGLLNVAPGCSLGSCCGSVPVNIVWPMLALLRINIPYVLCVYLGAGCRLEAGFVALLAYPGRGF